MNYLAHCYLAGDGAEAVVGGMLGDFVKGRPDARLGARIRAGIQLHRSIDTYTDGHPLVCRARRLVSPRGRRFAGILVDVFFDHFLARHWSRFSPLPLPDFTAGVYRSLHAHRSILPERLRRILPRMTEDDWLGSYGALPAVDLALHGIERRLTRDCPALREGVDELTARYDEFERQFFEYFPELIAFVRRYRSAPVSA